MIRPTKLVAVVGTSTEVGKTWVTCRLLGELRSARRTVAVRKPAQSFEPGSGPTDADLLAAASGEPLHQVCPPHRWYRVPMAPPMAIDALGLEPVTTRELLAELAWLAGVDVGVVETVGGVRSPLANDGDSLDLTAALAPDVVILVAHAGLGTINDVRLGADAIAGAVGFSPIVFLNHFDPGDDLHRRNLAWLAERDRYTVATSPAALAAGLVA